MAQKRKKTNSAGSKKANSALFAKINNPTTRAVLGLLILAFGLLSALAFVSFFIHWQEDQSSFSKSFWELFTDESYLVKNYLGKFGAALGQVFVFRWFGVSAFFVSYFFAVFGLRIAIREGNDKNFRTLRNSLLGIFWVSSFAGFVFGDNYSIWAGGIGFFFNQWLRSFFGTLGMLLFLLLTLMVFVAIIRRWTPETLHHFFDRLKSFHIRKPTNINNTSKGNTFGYENDDSLLYLPKTPKQEVDPKDRLEVDFTPEEPTPVSESDKNPKKETQELELEAAFTTPTYAPTPVIEEEEMEVEIIEEEPSSILASDGMLKAFGPYDPTLDLSKFQFPTLDLLDDHGSTGIQINQEELEANKNKIVETLNNYKIEIQKIKATIGPTVTLYEIVPAAGVRISKIKNLEDDIALSLAALGIRIIAPIPGKGTIGIEVPNTNPAVVSMRTVIASEKFQNSKMELPIALGKTISNETLVVDLAKMPHLLMAGATGQGKSVGLNCILTSLLYKKHPSQIKFVLVDPKKVELTLFNKIERHYLAKLPDTDDAIITDTTKVVHTLNSLCIEMDNRYELLKNAMVRNLKEYNTKFVARKLNPEEGHRFLPYIVLVIDEFADLIMTAGKEVEMPIARLAQLARAIGIHLIVATQRPSVNVITGIIKANFPARIAFRVTSKIDSRTILDTGGADQLIGKGDMLYSTGNELIRIQCAFVDTPEVEKITEFIGSQQAYPSAYHLPEYVGEDGGSGIDEMDPADRDAMFEDAARIVVINQQGSASLLQRKLKLGYNRAGRIVDQLEAAGIIGPFEGSKARQVLIPDEMSLEQLLNNKR
jgi:S-DNA-T family DNA segregation ATPase FtsK/SpoIIIE